MDDSVWKIVSTQLSSGPKTSATANPAMSRVRLSAPPRWGSEKPEPAAACVTMCTSMSPDSRMTVAPMPGPVKAAARRERRLTPSTSCVASDALAKSTSAFGMSSPTTWWNVPPSCSRRARCRSRASGCRARSPSGLVTWTPRRSPPELRAAIRAPRRSSVSPSGPPVSATTTRSRASHLPVMPCSAR